ncbi:hypothetical protein [Cellvibrio sp. QJXJ]|uniref:hypothetical protein n=1 Tax=Cellvibrio sp. QJXJ TaxID=2964606 RepID=UPI0021C4A3FF|nr:hypothetical protein [Cellvibrio sp. QJXJ]UUA74256.1 hypothetical protein NNX04_07395 [Cellvibrio sp. QJXJ]
MSDGFKGLTLLLSSLLLAWTLTGPAMNYGGIWELRVHPHRNVEVHLSNTTILIGTLSRSWDGDFTLHTTDGIRQFSREKIRFMSIPFNEELAKKRNESFFYSWRSFFPAAVVLSIYTSFLLYSFKFLRRWDSKVD